VVVIDDGWCKFSINNHRGGGGGGGGGGGVV
jgi:hypothetical protein